MLSVDENKIFKQHIVKRSVSIPKSCIIIRVKEVFELIDTFTSEAKHDKGLEKEI